MTFKMNAYNEYIAKSRYSRFLDKEGRREHWNETVARYFDFMAKHLKDKHNYILTDELRSELEGAVANLEVMPSMRAIMTAGEALERQNIAGYNCSYLPIDDAKAFDEAMYILLCGTGVGFCVDLASLVLKIHPLTSVQKLQFAFDRRLVCSEAAPV